MTDVDAVVQQIEGLLEEIGRASPAQRDIVEELIGLLMKLYGTGLSRIVEVLGEAGATAIAAKLADDKLVASLLLLHGLHPVSAETRVREALHRVQKRLDGHRLSLVDVAGDQARIEVERDGSGRLPPDLKMWIEHAVAESAPELTAVDISGLTEVAPLVQIEMAPAR